MGILVLRLYKTMHRYFLWLGKYAPTPAVAGDMGWLAPQHKRWLCVMRKWSRMSCIGGSNYDSLFVRTIAFPVQVAYWIKELIAPCGTSVPCQL